MTTGGSALKAIGRAREFGLKVGIILGVVDREEGGREALEREAPLVTLFRRRDFSMIGRVAIVLVAAAAAVGCRSQEYARVDFSDTPRDYIAKDYEGVWTRWTRHDYVLLDADKALEVWATFKSWDFREAFIERYASIYSLTDADRAKLRDAQRLAFQEAFEFHVTAQSSHFKWNDLEKTSSPWQLRPDRRARQRVAAGKGQGREAARCLRARVLSGADAVHEDLQRSVRRARGQQLLGAEVRHHHPAVREPDRSSRDLLARLSQGRVSRGRLRRPWRLPG